MIRGSLLLATLAAVAAPLAAQQSDRTLTTNDLQSVRPSTCPAADSIAGRPLPRPKEGAQGWREGDRHMIISNDPFAFTGHRPVDGIMLNAVYTGEAPLPQASYTIQLHLKDSVLRTGGAAALTFILDSAEVAVGTMEALDTPFSHGHTVDQMLTLPILPSIARRLALAQEVRVRIGTWEFTVPDKTLETFHAVFLATTCGAHLR